MKRQSSRSSVFPQQVPTDMYWQSLDLCAQALHATSTSLNNSISTLGHGVGDFPRLQTVIKTRRCFEVVTETDVRRAQRNLADEIEPQIKELIERAELGLGEMKSREKNLRARVEKRAAASRAPTALTSATSTVDRDARERHLAQLRAKKLELSRIGNRLDEERRILMEKVGHQV